MIQLKTLYEGLSNLCREQIAAGFLNLQKKVKYPDKAV
jgi:hypothetical protein